MVKTQYKHKFMFQKIILLVFYIPFFKFAGITLVLHSPGMEAHVPRHTAPSLKSQAHLTHIVNRYFWQLHRNGR